MSSNTARFESWPWRLPLVALFVAMVVARIAEPRLVPPAGSLAGGSLAVLGGLRAVAAGGAWLQANLAWERRDAEATERLLEIAVTADERPLYFWSNAARIMAYDFPSWRSAGLPVAIQRQIAAEEAQRALALLERGLARHPAKGAFYLEIADIRLRALADREGAAEYFRLAAEQPGAPHHAARIHAELLRELGRPAEALAWLRRIQPTLPADDPAAMPEVVAQRIRELELELGGG